MGQEELIRGTTESIRSEILEVRNIVDGLGKYTIDQITQYQIPAIHIQLDRAAANADRLVRLTYRTEPISILSVVIAFWCVIASMIAGFLLSVWLDDWTCVARSGAVISILGVLLLGWQILQSRKQMHKIREKISVSGGFSNESGPVLAFFDWQNVATTGAAVGLCFVVFGTLMWAFGDLIAKLQ